MEMGDWVAVSVIQCERGGKKPLYILDAKLHLSSVWN